MTRQQIDRFFRVLAHELNRPARVIVTGAAAGALMGSVRPSLDVDFAVALRGAPRYWPELEAAIARTVRRTGIQANYAEDIDRWGQVSLLDYRRHTRRYRRIGSLEIRLLEPAYWSIGKITRYLVPDVQDLTAVLARQRVPVRALVGLWGRALRRSPRSDATTRFRDQAEHFLCVHGPAVWGSRFDADDAIRRFRRAAGIRSSSK